jgi:uncharacterized DUF497 family protein
MEFIDSTKLTFEWDENKRIINLKKHNIDFEIVRYFFETPYLSKLDGRYDYGEERYIGLGLLRHQVVVLVFTKRKEYHFRFISCRRANIKEARNYYEHIKIGT